MDAVHRHDEVAVRHGPAEIGYLAVSEAMVNIRATLARAVADRVIADPDPGRARAPRKSEVLRRAPLFDALGRCARGRLAGGRLLP